MAERFPVEEDVVGSKPIRHPDEPPISGGSFVAVVAPAGRIFWVRPPFGILRVHPHLPGAHVPESPGVSHPYGGGLHFVLCLLFVCGVRLKKHFFRRFFLI
jgi:hypothetical protein